MAAAAGNPLIPQTLGILQDLKKHQSMVSVGVDAPGENLVVDKPFPMSDEEIPLKPGQADRARAMVADMSARFKRGENPTEADAADVLGVVDTDAIDWSKYR